MPYIKQITIDQATGLLKRELEKAVARAGRVWNIVANHVAETAATMKASMEMYGATMFAESPLSRQQREMLAVVVSKVANGCDLLNPVPRA